MKQSPSGIALGKYRKRLDLRKMIETASQDSKSSSSEEKGDTSKKKDEALINASLFRNKIKKKAETPLLNVDLSKQASFFSKKILTSGSRKQEEESPTRVKKKTSSILKHHQRAQRHMTGDIHKGLFLDEKSSEQSPTQKSRRGRYKDKSSSSKQVARSPGKKAQKKPTFLQSQSSLSGQSKINPENEPVSSDSDTLSSHTESSEQSNDQNPELGVFQKIEEYYTDNFEAHLINTKFDLSSEKIWNAAFDDQNDQVLLIVAQCFLEKTNDADSNTVTAKDRVHRRTKALAKLRTPKVEAETISPFTKYHMTRQLNQRDASTKVVASHDPFKKTTFNVEFNLEFQVWKVDAESIKELSKPVFQQTLMTRRDIPIKKDVAPKDVNDYLRNMFQDYAGMIRAASNIHMVADGNRILTLNTNDNRVEYFKGKIDIKEDLRAFKQAIHRKSAWKSNQPIENYLLVTYYQQSPLCDKTMTESRMRASPFGKTHSNKNFVLSDERSYKHTEQSNERQLLGLHLINYQGFLDPFHKQLRANMIQEQFLQFSDDTLAEYYSNESNFSIHSFTLQRIGDSGTYILLFPTGLLVHIQISTFTILAKIQLHIKMDETLRDISYCVDEQMKNQCFWLLDCKNQVWRCTNELDPNSCNWNLSKVSVLDTFSYKKFLHPAMTFTSYSDIGVLLRMHCLRAQRLEVDTNSQFMLLFNESTTKACLIKQPRDTRSRNQFQVEEESPQPSSSQKKFKSPQGLSLPSELFSHRSSSSRRLNRRILMYLISKKQPFIMKKLKEIKKQAKYARSLSIKAQQLKFQVLKGLQIQNSKNEYISNLTNMSHFDNLNFDEFIKLNRDTSKLIFIGRVKTPSDPEIRQLKEQAKWAFGVLQFMVQRKRSLELFYMNGTQITAKRVSGSEVKAPIEIADLQMNFDRSLVLIKYCSSTRNNKVMFKIFKKDQQTSEFTLFDDPNMTRDITEKPELVGLYIEKGFLVKEVHFEIRSTKEEQISKLQSHRKSRSEKVEVLNNAYSLKISIPDVYLAANLGNFPIELFNPNDKSQKVLSSPDGRTILCGRILLRLSELHDEVLEMGCIIALEMGSSSEYAFFSLIDKRERKGIFKVLKGGKVDSILQFENVLFPYDTAKHFYMQLEFDKSRQVTPILKIFTETLDCLEIYQAKFQVTMTTIYELKVPMKKSEKLLSSKGVAEIQIDQLWNEDRLLEDGQNTGGVSKGDRKIHLNSQTIGTMETLRDKGKRGAYLALLGQSKHHTQIEIIKDSFEIEMPQAGDIGMILKTNHEKSFESAEENNVLFAQEGQPLPLRQTRWQQCRTKLSSLFKKNLLPKEASASSHQKTVSMFFLTVHSKSEIQAQSALDFIAKDKLLLALNNEFFVLNLKVQELVQVKNRFQYGIQQFSSSMFLTFVKAKQLQSITASASGSFASLGELSVEDEEQKEQSSLKTNQIMQTVTSCLQRMDLATLKKYAMIKQLRPDMADPIKIFHFFTPHEELNGSNIFSKISHSYTSIHPYLERIDGELITKMNQSVRNIAVFTDPQVSIFLNIKHRTEAEADKSKPGETELAASTEVHMYQHDLLGMNAIDYAFQRNAIYCIKAFVETLLVLPNVTQFRNCFDKALLLMINRGMDVKGLVNSQLFYPQIWTKYSYFSSNKETQVLAYNQEVDILINEDPNDLFPDEEDQDESIQINRQKFDQQQLVKDEQFEMQFHYIFMQEIEGDDKLEVSRTLKDCEDIQLFEQESIQAIIDYKWSTYGKDFFLFKFYIYFMFLVFYYIDIEMYSSDEYHVKNWLFYSCKFVCTVVNLLFFLYELVQMKNDGSGYFTDAWNYLELTGNMLYQTGAVLDIIQEDQSSLCRMIISMSIIFTLAKMVYLIRVFRQLNFLVTMLITVVNEISYFMILFALFLFTFAESFHVLEVDMSAYGRAPSILAYFVSVLRCAMGDFSIIHYTMGFDIQDEGPDGEPEYRFSRPQMVFTFVVFMLCSFYIFIIFMNFLIAVIVQSYNKVIQNKEAFDYLQRANMINEREGYFTQQHLENSVYFPKVIVIRKMKSNADPNTDPANSLVHLKNYVKAQSERQIEQTSTKINETFQALTSSVKIIEMDLQNVNKDFDKVHKSFAQITDLNLKAQRASFFGNHSKAMGVDSSASSYDQVGLFPSPLKAPVKVSRDPYGSAAVSQAKVSNSRMKLITPPRNAPEESESGSSSFSKSKCSSTFSSPMRVPVQSFDLRKKRLSQKSSVSEMNNSEEEELKQEIHPLGASQLMNSTMGQPNFTPQLSCNVNIKDNDESLFPTPGGKKQNKKQLDISECRNGSGSKNSKKQDTPGFDWKTGIKIGDKKTSKNELAESPSVQLKMKFQADGQCTSKSRIEFSVKSTRTRKDEEDRKETSAVSASPADKSPDLRKKLQRPITFDQRSTNLPPTNAQATALQSETDDIPYQLNLQRMDLVEQVPLNSDLETKKTQTESKVVPSPDKEEIPSPVTQLKSTTPMKTSISPKKQDSFAQEFKKMRTLFESKFKEVQSENRELRALLAQVMETQKHTLQISKGTAAKVDSLQKAAATNTEAHKKHNGNFDKVLNGIVQVRSSLNQMKNKKDALGTVRLKDQKEADSKSLEAQPKRKERPAPQLKSSKPQTQKTSKVTSKRLAIGGSSSNERMEYSRNNFIMNPSHSKNESMKKMLLKTNTADSRDRSWLQGTKSTGYIPLNLTHRNKALQHILNNSLEKSTDRSKHSGPIRVDDLTYRVLPGSSNIVSKPIPHVNVPIPDIDNFLRTQINDIVTTSSLEKEYLTKTMGPKRSVASPYQERAYIPKSAAGPRVPRVGRGSQLLNLKPMTSKSRSKPPPKAKKASPKKTKKEEVKPLPKIDDDYDDDDDDNDEIGTSSSDDRDLPQDEDETSGTFKDSDEEEDSRDKYEKRLNLNLLE